MYRFLKTSLAYKFCSVNRMNTQIIGISSKDTELILQKLKKFNKFDDRFRIGEMTSKEKLLDLFNSRRQKLSLNEQIKIMQRISELNGGESYKTIYGIDSVIQKIEKRFEMLDFDEDIYLGCLIDGLQNLEYYEKEEMWIHICDSILHDRFEVEGEQAYKILKGIAFTKVRARQEYKIELMRRALNKVRDIMAVVILDQQYVYKLCQLREMCNIFQQQHMLNNNLMKLLEFSTYKIFQLHQNDAFSHSQMQDIIHINFIFSINSYYSHTINSFLSSSQFNTFIHSSIHSNSFVDSNIIKIMAIAIFLKSQTHTELNFDSLIEDKLGSLDFSQFSLSDLNIILSSLTKMNVTNSKQIIQSIDEIILKYQSESFTIGDLKDTLMIREYRDDQLNQFAITVSKSQLHPFHVIEFLEYINAQNIEHLFKELYNVLPTYLADNCNCYNWEQQCLLYYFMRKDQHLFYDFHHQNGYLNVLKEYIKLTYAQKSTAAKYIQPLSTSSNFYKILTVIDLADLFSDSHYT